MDDSVLILPSPEPPEVIHLDDEEAYLDLDNEVEVITQILQPAPPAGGDPFLLAVARTREKGRSSLSGRRVFSPTDELLELGSFNLSLAEAEEEDTPSPSLLLRNPHTKHSKEAAEVEDEEELSIIEIIPPPTPPADHDISISSTTPTKSSSTRTTPKPAVLSNRAFRKKVAKEKFLRKRLLKQQQQRLSSGGKRIIMAERRQRQLSPAAPPGQGQGQQLNGESRIQQNLRKLCNRNAAQQDNNRGGGGGGGGGGAAVSSNYQAFIQSLQSPKRKALKRLKNTRYFNINLNQPTSSSTTSDNWNPTSTDQNQGQGQGQGQKRRRGGRRGGGRQNNKNKLFRIDKSNQENVISSTTPGNTFDTPPYLSTNKMWISNNHGDNDGGRPPVPRRLLEFEPQPPSLLLPSQAFSYSTSTRSRGRGGSRVPCSMGRGFTRSTTNNLPQLLSQGRVPRDFELASARFIPPPPLTYSVDSLGSNMFSDASRPGAAPAGAGGPGEDGGDYDPMTMFSQARAAAAAAASGKASASATNNAASSAAGAQSGEAAESAPCSTTTAAKCTLSKFGDNFYAPSQTVPPVPGGSGKGKGGGLLRPIIVDGSNVAMAHGNKAAFSCQGIRLCVDYFKTLGHTTIIVFVPHFRGRRTQVLNGELLDELEKEGIVKFTPGRMVDGMRISSYDDRFIVQTAAQMGGVIVSNDNFRDLFEQEPSWRDTIRKRVLQFLWVTPDIIMFPNDPLGRDGPRLSQFLAF